MKTKTKILITKIFILFVFVAVVIFDIVVALNGEMGEGDTISEVTLATSLRIHFIPYAVGVLMAHLFWPRKRKELPFALALIGCIVIGIGYQYLTHIINLRIIPIFSVAIGIFPGYLLWYQDPREINNG